MGGCVNAMLLTVWFDLCPGSAADGPGKGLCCQHLWSIQLPPAAGNANPVSKWGAIEPNFNSCLSRHKLFAAQILSVQQRRVPFINILALMAVCHCLLLNLTGNNRITIPVNILYQPVICIGVLYIISCIDWIWDCGVMYVYCSMCVWAYMFQSRLEYTAGWHPFALIILVS